MHERAFEISRASVNEETGEFRATLFTSGEASDGHILSIPGGDVPARMPLFINHSADPTTQLGSIYLDGRDDRAIQVRGQIMLEGEGREAEIRRDILAKIAAGHVSRMSGRWDAEDKNVKARTELDADHPAYVSKKESDYRKKYGYFFEKWRAMEGSVVGLGADPKAVMRFAEDEEVSETVREFWREQIPIEEPPMEERSTHEQLEERIVHLVAENDEVVEGARLSINDIRELKDVFYGMRTDSLVGEPGPVIEDLPQEPAVVEPTLEPEPEVRIEEPTSEGRLAAFGAYLREMINSGLDPTDLKEVLDTETAEHPSVAHAREMQDIKTEMQELRSLLSQERVIKDDPLPSAPPADEVARELLALARQKSKERVQGTLDQVRGIFESKVTPEPTSEISPVDIGRALHDELQKAKQESLAEFRTLLDHARGNKRKSSDVQEMLKKVFKR